MKPKPFFISFVIFIFFCQTILITVAAATSRIMPLGDSITKGYVDGTILDPERVGYRKKLYSDLIDEDYDVDFVGSLENGLFADPWHEGHGGFMADEIRDGVYVWLEDNPAAVILLHIGTNDISNGQSAAGVRDEIEEILYNIDDYEVDNKTEVMVILARIINQQDPDTPAGVRTSTLNSLLQTLVNTRSEAGDKIRIVDHENALIYPDDMADTWHPNMTGYHKMADVWFNDLEQILPVADFTADTTSATIPLTVSFTDESSGEITDLTWDFGDGLGSSTNQNPSYTYNDPGTYTVSLTATGPAGTDTETKTDYITVINSTDGGGGGGGGCFISTAAHGL